MPKTKRRKIVVNDKTYHWFYNGKGKVVLWDENDTKSVFGTNEVSKMNWDDIERGQCKGWFSIMPRTIAEFVKEKGL